MPCPRVIQLIRRLNFVRHSACLTLHRTRVIPYNGATTAQAIFVVIYFRGKGCKVYSQSFRLYAVSRIANLEHKFLWDQSM